MTTSGGARPPGPEPVVGRPGAGRPVGDGPAAGRLLADLAQDIAEPPPPGLRVAVLAAVRGDQERADWPDPAQLPAPARPLVRQAALLDSLLVELPTGPPPGPLAGQLAGQLAGEGPRPWDRLVVNGWSVRQVVAHLAAVDGCCAEALGLPVPAEAGASGDGAVWTGAAGTAGAAGTGAAGTAGAAGKDAGAGGAGSLVHRRTVAAFARLGADPARTRAVWRGQLVAILRHAAVRPDLTGPVDYLGMPLAAADVLLDRAFETWVHTEDLRAALDLPGLPPEPADAHLLADLGLRMLPLTWPDDAPAGSFDVVLNGPGGGRWTGGPSFVAAGSTVASARGTVALDVVDFCRLAGGRLLPADVRHTASDPDLARIMLTATAALARL